MKGFSHYVAKLTEKGITQIISDRFSGYKEAFQMDNWLVGRYVELTGNTIRLDGLTLDVNNPLVTTRHKSSLYFGIYEIPERELAARFIDRSLPVVEVGGSIGGVSCFVNRLLCDRSQHVVLECNPFVLPTLERNRSLNNALFSIEPIALAYGSDSISFNVDVHHFMLGTLSSSGGKSVSVQTSTLGQIANKYKFETFNLLSDSEGAEVEMISNEAELLRTRVKHLIIETHEEIRGRDAAQQVLIDLQSLGFELQERDSMKNVFAMVNSGLL